MDLGPRIVLQKLLPSCLELLHAEYVKPHLLSGGAITLHEYEEIRIGPSLPTQRALAEKLVVLLMRKGPGCADRLLQALEMSVQGVNPQPSHYQLIYELKGALAAGGSSFLSTCARRPNPLECGTGVPNGFTRVDTNDGEHKVIEGLCNPGSLSII